MAQIVECEICYEEYQEDTLEEHREMCFASSIFQCTICDGNYVCKEGLWNHLDLHKIADESKKLHSKEMKATYKLYQCALCNDQRGYQENIYWKHVHEVHDDFLLCCSDCGKRFLSQKLKNDHVLTHCNDREQTLTDGLDLENFSNIALPMQDENTATLVSCGEIHENAALELEPLQEKPSCGLLEDSKCSEINKVYHQDTLVQEKLNEENDTDSRLIEFSPASSNVHYDTVNITEKVSEPIPIPSSKRRSESDADQIPLKMEITVEETRLLKHDDFEDSSPNKSSITDCPNYYQDSKDIKPKHFVLSSAKVSEKSEEESRVITNPSANRRSETDADQITLKMEITVEETTLLQPDDFGISTLNQSTIADCSYVGKHLKDQRGKHSELPSVEFSGQNLALTSERKSDVLEEFSCTSSDQDIVDSRLNEPSSLKFKSLHSANVHKKRNYVADKVLRKAQVVQIGCIQQQEKMNSEMSLLDCNRRRKHAQPLVQNPSSASSDEICSHCGKKFVSVKSLSHHIESFCKPTTFNICEKLYPNRESTQDHKINLRKKKQLPLATRKTRQKAGVEAHPEPELKSVDNLPVPLSKRFRVTRDPPVDITSDKRPRLSRQAEKRSHCLSRSRSSHPATRRTQQKVVQDTLPKPDSSKSPNCLPVQSGKRSRATRDPPVNITSDHQPRSSRPAEKRSRPISRSLSSHPATRQTQRKAVPDAQPKPDSLESPDCLPAPSGERSQATRDPSVWITSDQRCRSSRQAEKRSSSINRSRSSHPATRRTQRSVEKRSQTLRRTLSSPPVDHTSTSSDASESSSEEISWKANSSRKRTKIDPSDCLPVPSGERSQATRVPPVDITSDQRPRLSRQAKKQSRSITQSRSSHPATRRTQQKAVPDTQPKMDSLESPDCLPIPSIDRYQVASDHPAEVTSDQRPSTSLQGEKRSQTLRRTHSRPPPMDHTDTSSESSESRSEESSWEAGASRKRMKEKQKRMSKSMEISEQQVGDDLERNQNSSFQKPEACSICGLIFENKSKLPYHRLIAHTEPKLKCSHCSKMFYYNYDLKLHETSHSKTTERNVVCEICHKTFRNKRGLQCHIYSAHPSTAVSCSKCALKFSNREKLWLHMRKAHIVPKHKCSHCPKMFHKICELNRHKIKHKSLVKKEECELCPSTFRDAYYLQVHVRNAHSSSEFPCNMCDLKFSNRHKLWYHRRTAHAEPKLKCSQCPKMFFRNFDLNHHETTHNKTLERNVVCELCPNTFQDKNGLRHHVNYAHRSSELPCGKCDLKFSTRTKLITHMRKAHIEPTYKCSHCPKKFFTNSQLKYHETTHSKTLEKKEVCELCPSTFRDKYLLQKHVYMVHPSSEMPCDKCDLKFSSRNKLRVHMEKAHTVPKHKCSQCSKMFYKKCVLIHHENTTHSKKNVECSQCSNMFSTNYNLQIHVNRVHPSSELPCGICALKFSNHNKLNHHVLTAHTDPKYKCSQCPMMFYLNQHRNHHEKTHSKTQERNIACKLCSMAFRDDRDLQKHVYNVHPPSELPCGKCALKFSTRTKLMGHMNTIHNLRFKCPKCEKPFCTQYTLQKHMDLHSKATQKRSSDGSKRHWLVQKGEKRKLSSDDSYVVDQRKIRKMPSSEIRRSNRMRAKQ